MSAIQFEFLQGMQNLQRVPVQTKAGYAIKQTRFRADNCRVGMESVIEILLVLIVTIARINSNSFSLGREKYLPSYGQTMTTMTMTTMTVGVFIFWKSRCHRCHRHRCHQQTRYRKNQAIPHPPLGLRVCLRETTSLFTAKVKFATEFLAGHRIKCLSHDPHKRTVPLLE